jgi:hypothetical protein
MTSINPSFGTIASFDLKAETKKSEKKERYKNANKDIKELDKTEKKGALTPEKGTTDAFTKHYTNLLDKNYETRKMSASFSFDHSVVGDLGASHKSKQNFDLNNGSKQKIELNNKDGMENYAGVFETDRNDTLKLRGKGWKKTENVTDLESLKMHQKDPKNKVLTGNLYEDNHGNKILLVGDGKDNVEMDQKTKNKKPEKKPENGKKHDGHKPKGKSGHLLDKDYETYRYQGASESRKWSADSSHDLSSVNGSVDEFDKNGYDHMTVDSRGGLKKARGVFVTDKYDTITLKGKGWHRAETNWTDQESLKRHQKDPNSKVHKGDLYKDANGNTFLVQGGARVIVEVEKPSA